MNTEYSFLLSKYQNLNEYPTDQISVAAQEKTDITSFLNQTCASLRPVQVWYLKIDSVQIISMCVCVSAPRLLITSGMMWRDMDPI